MFRTVPLSIIRSFSQYTQQWFMSYGFADSLRAGSGRICVNNTVGYYLRHSYLGSYVCHRSWSPTVASKLNFKLRDLLF